MATMMPLQQTLKSLCSRTGWCYAVFWKLKRRSRMMLTWEDGYYDNLKSAVDASHSHGGDGHFEMGGNPLDQGGSGDMEGQIGLAVARMSYFVYSMGEGVIGRVAFTGKHQWVFHDGENHLEGALGGKANQSVSEKNPDGWQNQFAAGIKTIAVIAVPQGVVQLGSTKLMQEDLKWIDHIKSVFGALQTAPSAPRPDLLSEGQGGRLTYNSMPPFLAGSNISVTAKKPVMIQQGQPLLTNAEDAVRWQKFGVQASPVGVNIQGLQSMGGAPSIAGTVKQEVQHQQPMKVMMEPQISKYASAELKPQTVQVRSNVPRFDVPSKSNKMIFSCDNMRSHSLGDIRSEQCNDSTRTGLVTGDISHSLLNDLKRDHVVPTCVMGQVDESFSLPQEEYSSKTRFSLCSMPDTKKEDAFVNVPFSFRAHERQQLDIQTKHMLNQHLSNLKNVSSIPTTQECADLSSVTDKMVDQECLNSVCPTAADVNSYLPSEFCIPKVHNNEGFTTATKGDAHWNAFGKDSRSKSESQCTERDSDFCSLSSQNDVNTLDELEKFLASFSKEENVNWDCSFAIGDELSQALGPAFWKGSMEEPSTSPASQKNMQLGVSQGRKEYMGELGTKWGSKLVGDNSYRSLPSVCPSEGKQEPLLDAVVGTTSISHHSVSSNTDASFAEKTSFPNVTGGLPLLNVGQKTEPTCSSSLSGKILQVAPNHETMLHCGNLVGGVKNPQCHQHLCLSNDMHTNMTPHSWTDEGQSLRSDDTRHSLSSKRSDDLSKSSKKRSRSGESTRPRPKDRQQIQDRVRELRDIVPNGSKCSIDALLEKTIKHMLFLHSVTLHADQLKNNGELKEDSDSDASWAVELVSQDKRYPIFVKDLNQPRQMLVEMVCEESDLFLEIADIIRSLGLTILRGVMESHSEKFWAKFVVEANRDIQRVDVLVSLINRLHLDNNSSSSSMTMASQSAPLRPQQGVDSGSSYTVCGNK